MKYNIKRVSGTSIEVDAMNYEEKNGFFTFYSNFELPGLNTDRVNIASIPFDDVELIILDSELKKNKRL